MEFIQINKKNRVLKIILFIILFFLALGFGAFQITKTMVKSTLNNMNHTDLPKDNQMLGINTSAINDSSDNSITNILLIGTDTRNPNIDSSNADSIMILTIDKKNNKLKVTSIMRDSIVNVYNYGQRKITESHNIGGPLLTLQTVNENYDLNIKDYVQVNFFSVSKIIDQIGTISVNLKADEVTMKDFAINFYIREIMQLENAKPEDIEKEYITTPGPHELDGIQATAYSRIRYVGNADFERTERQRLVLSQLFKKLSTTSLTKLSTVANTITPYIETSLSSDDMINLAAYILVHNMSNFEQSRVPFDGMYRDQKVNGEDGLAWDQQATIDKLHKFIFETD